jgi:3-oxoacyl-(acyl-carrier-protein) synthase
MSVNGSFKDVVVTGIGVITPLDAGNGVVSFWDSACRGVNAIKPIVRFDTAGHRCRVGAEIEGLANLHDDQTGCDVEPSARLMALAFQQAVNDAALKSDVLKKAGVAVGTILAGIGSAEKYWAERFSSKERPRQELLRGYCLDSLAQRMVRRFTLEGPSFAMNTACCSGADSIRTAASQIRAGRVSVMLAGGVDVLSEFVFRGFSALNAMTTDGKVRPFDRNRRGLALGEGAGALILESRDHAEARGAEIYCLLAGSGTAADAAHLVKPHRNGEGLARAITRALESASMSGTVDFICAHGTGTPYNDSMEAKAIKGALNGGSSKVRVTSIKSMIGHTLGAASAIEAVACVKAMETGIIPPTINFESQDPECDLQYVLNKPVQTRIDACMSLSAGFGGQNTALIFRRVN